MSATSTAIRRPAWWAELVIGSGVCPELAAANVAAFGPGTDRHWEDERAELVAHARLLIQTASTTASGLPQAQPGHLAGRLINLQQRYRHLAAGGWRTLSAELPGLPRFDQWKPAQLRARHDKPGRSIKYEAPPSFPDGGGLLLPNIDERHWRLICERQGLPFPDAATRAAGFWPWALRTRKLRLLICEGWKKALAAVTAGHAAVALPGVQMGRRVATDGTERLIAALQLLATPGRRWLIAFDAEAKPSTAAKVRAAAAALARTLRTAGGTVQIARLPLLPGTDKSGLDDLLASRGTAALDDALARIGPDPVLPRLRRADCSIGAGRFLGDVITPSELADHRLLAIAAPMGSGKTTLARDLVAPHLAEGVPLLAPTHRTSLGESAAAALGIPWAAEPGTDARLQGLGLCWDSLRPSSALAIRPEEWSGADAAGPVLILDEVAQGIEHLLFGTGTAVADHRPETMATTAELLRSARQLVAMDAQLSAPVLELLEALTGQRAHLIRSAHQPMAGRSVTVPQGHTARSAAQAGRAHVLQLAQNRRRALVVTTAQDAGVKNSAQNLGRLVRRHWPDARILLIDSEHPEAAELLGSDPNGVAAAHDWIIASPSITSGLSIDAPGLFDEVVVIGAGGRLTCEHLAQAAARVRDPGCPVTIYAPAVAPQLRCGSGDASPAELLKHLAACEARLLADLVSTAGWNPAATNESPWLRCWLELAAHRNRQSHSYAATIAGLLRAEGWHVQDLAAPPPSPDQQQLQQLASAELAEIAEQAQAAVDQAVITAAPITAQEAAELTKRRRLSPADRAKLQRHRIATAWGLGTAAPTPELLEADREGLNRRARFGWILRSIEARQLAAAHDQQRAQQLAPNGNGWAPDLTRELLGHRIAAADALGLPSWLERAGEWLSAEALEQSWQLNSQPPSEGETLEQEALRRATNRCRSDRRQLLSVLGISAGKRASGTLRSLLRLAGFTLEAERRRIGSGQRQWFYRVRPEALPRGADLQPLQQAWAQQLRNPGPQR